MPGASPYYIESGDFYMDKIDKMIINMLQENARATISDISNKVSLTLPAVSERLKKLEASGIIEKYTAIINPKKVNKGLSAMVYASFSDAEREKYFSEFVKNEGAITECHFITGPFQYCMKVFTESPAALQELTWRIREMGATKTDVMLLLSTVVERPSIQLTE